MLAGLNPFSFLVVSVAGWINQRQQQLIEYLVEENRVLREHIGNRRMRFTDDQRRRLAAKANKLGRRVLVQVATIVTPETLLASKVQLRWLLEADLESVRINDGQLFHSVMCRLWRL